MAWGGDGHEVNFLEALDHAYKAYVAPVVPDECQAVLQSARARQLSAQSADFWFLARGLVDFVDANDGVLPLTGVVPDMTASTETYVALQLVYVTKAKQDAAQVQCFVRQQLQALGLPPDRISTEQVETFCKNCYNLGVRWLDGSAGGCMKTLTPCCRRFSTRARSLRNTRPWSWTPWIWRRRTLRSRRSSGTSCCGL